MARPRRKSKVRAVPKEYEDGVINRINECQVVIGDLDNSPVWRIVKKDLEEQRQMLDDNWQEIVEVDKLQKARELKMATLHILNLKTKYEDELRARQKELKDIQSTDTNIIKDYDT